MSFLRGGAAALLDELLSVAVPAWPLLRRDGESPALASSASGGRAIALPAHLPSHRAELSAAR
jgi:hypothetical protein